MTKKSWRNPNKEVEEKPQKFNWKSHKVFDDFSSADEERKKLLEGKQKFVKIRRCGPGGTKFKVKIGNPIKVKTEDNQSST